MVTLPQLNEWSSADLLRARSLSPAIDRYLKILTAPTVSFADELRHQRHREWTRAALAALLTDLPAQNICQFWSESCLQILRRAWEKEELQNESVCLITMGKLGAGELNLSSDIDIYFVSEKEPSKVLIKKVRSWLNDLTEIRPSGFCFRVDLDLRPGGSTAPLVQSFEQMTNHYGYHGETWERVALIRQDIPLGPPQLTQDIANFCRKFSFRKHIDYGLFHDLQSLRSKIQAHKMTSSTADLKFRRGGIRDLELLIQSLQLIHGGKSPSLQTRSLSSAIATLQQAGHLSASDAKTLAESYWFFRDLENKLHSENDQYTYDLNQSHVLTSEQKELFTIKAESIAQIVDQFLSPYQKKVPATLMTSAEINDHDEKFKTAWEELQKIKLQSRSLDRDRNEWALFLNNVLVVLQKGVGDRFRAVEHLHQFLLATKAKTSFLSLLNQHLELLEELLWIFSCSPFLSQILIHRPELVDSFLLKTADINTQDEDLFFSSIQDFKLMSDLIASSRFLRQKNVLELTQNLSQTTDTLVLAVLEFLRKKWKEPLQILCLGKWATGQMGLTSDLDFVFLSDTTASEAQMKLARRFIHVLNSPHSGQKLYNIDLRLRPSGSAGPLIVTRSELQKYLTSQAAVWERQAYLCYRILPTEESVPLFTPRPLTTADQHELRDIQSKLLVNDPLTIDLKKNKGGLLHSELAVQAFALANEQFPSTPSFEGLCEIVKNRRDPVLGQTIYDNYQKLRTSQQLLILLSQAAEAKLSDDSADLELLSALLGTSPKVVLSETQSLLNEQKMLLDKLTDEAD